MGDKFAALAALNFSIAARAYWVGLKALDLGVDATDAALSQPRTEAARREMRVTLAAIERLAARMDLTWQTIPLDRQLQTQVGMLIDTMYYASPEAVQGYGFLKPAATDYLSAWRQPVMMVMETLEEAVEGRGTEAEPLVPEMPAVGDLGADALSKDQRSALNGFVNAFAADLLLAEARSLATLPPGHPTIVSPYSELDLARILAGTHALEACLNALTSAFALGAFQCATVATIVQRAVYHARDCLRQVSGAASALGDRRTPAFAKLSIAAGRDYLLALNLT